MKTYLTLVSLLLSSASVNALAACIAFDINWNLLAFNLNGKDYNAGTQDTWGSGSATDITTSGRPPFDNPNMTCYLSQFGNAIYLMGADKSNPANIAIYDATAKSWSTQVINANGTKFDPSNFVAILDHDTDVFYALSNGELSNLKMDIIKQGNSTPIPWNDVQTPPWSTAGYQPVMALAQNHVHFLDVPGVAAGSAQIFVIHFSFFQPDAQKYGDFPATHGQTASIFLDEGVQQEFIFVPDDGSQTYVINAESNTTQTLAGPPTKDPQALYFAAPASIVQLASSGAVSYLAYNPNNTQANTAASWTTVQNLASVAPPGSGVTGPSGSNTSTGGSSSNSSGSSGGSKGSGGSGSSGNGTSSGGNSGSGAETPSVALGMATGLLFGSIALLLC